MTISSNVHCFVFGALAVVLLPGHLFAADPVPTSSTMVLESTVNVPRGPVVPTVAEVMKALGDADAMRVSGEDYKLTITRQGGDGKTVSREMKRGASSRRDIVVPHKHAFLQDKGRVLAWSTSSVGWVDLGISMQSSAVGAPTGLQGFTPPPGKEPLVEWKDHPRILEVTIDNGVGGKTVLTVDWARKVQTGRRLLGPSGEVIWQEEWQTEPWKSGHRVIRRVITGMGSGQVNYSEDWEWQSGPGSVSGEDLFGPP